MSGAGRAFAFVRIDARILPLWIAANQTLIGGDLRLKTLFLTRLVRTDAAVCGDPFLSVIILAADMAHDHNALSSRQPRTKSQRGRYAILPLP